MKMKVKMSRVYLFCSWQYLLHQLSLSFLTKHQLEIIKGLIVDIDNQYSLLLTSSILNLPLNKELSTSFLVVFFFHSFNKHNNNSLAFLSHQLNSLALFFSENYTCTFIITNASIKNNVAISIAYIHIHDKPVVKTLYFAVNINSTEAKLFAIRYSINQATNSISICKIIVITDSIYVAKKIFELLLHLFQIHLAVIL